MRCEENDTVKSVESFLPYLSKKCKKYSLHKKRHTNTFVPALIHELIKRANINEEIGEEFVRVAGYGVGIGLSGCSFGG